MEVLDQVLGQALAEENKFCNLRMSSCTGPANNRPNHRPPACSLHCHPYSFHIPVARVSAALVPVLELEC